MRIVQVQIMKWTAINAHIFFPDYNRVQLPKQMHWKFNNTSFRMKKKEQQQKIKRIKRMEIPFNHQFAKWFEK